MDKARQFLKERIKELAAEQTATKKARKTGPYTLPRTGYGYVDYNKVPDKVKASWQAVYKVQINKAVINAALNLYHQVRGSNYRHCPHDPDYGYEYAYNIAEKDLKKELEKHVGMVFN